jgi:hypothetical protein
MAMVEKELQACSATREMLGFVFFGSGLRLTLREFGMPSRDLSQSVPQQQIDAGGDNKGGDGHHGHWNQLQRAFVHTNITLASF